MYIVESPYETTVVVHVDSKGAIVGNFSTQLIVSSLEVLADGSLYALVDTNGTESFASLSFLQSAPINPIAFFDLYAVGMTCSSDTAVFQFAYDPSSLIPYLLRFDSRTGTILQGPSLPANFAFAITCENYQGIVYALVQEGPTGNLTLMSVDATTLAFMAVSVSALQASQSWGVSTLTGDGLLILSLADSTAKVFFAEIQLPDLSIAYVDTQAASAYSLVPE